MGNSLTEVAGIGGDTAARLQDFESVREKRAYERRVLPLLKTVVDFDLACEIGYHQLVGSPLTVKQLLLLNLAPPATVLRRVDRLCALGIVLRGRSNRDGRVHHLELTQETLRLFANYSRAHTQPPGPREKKVQ